MEARQPQQAHRGARREGRRRSGSAAVTRRRRECVGREFSPRHHGATRTRARRAARTKSIAGDHPGERLRPRRALRVAARFRHDRRGDVGLRRTERRTRRAAAPATDRPHRRGHRAGCCVRHHGRPALRRRSGGRRQPARHDVPDHGPACLGVRRAGRAATAPRFRVAVHGAARDVSVLGRSLGGGVDQQRLGCRTSDGVARRRRRRAIRHLHRTNRAPRRTRTGHD